LESLKRKFKFSLILLNDNSEKNKKCEKTHEFSQNSREAGEIETSKENFTDETRGFIKNGECKIEIQLEVCFCYLNFNLIQALEEEEETSGYNYFYQRGKQSKQNTGMVGLEKQGATSYMNSLLQTLYHTNLFRWVKIFLEIDYNLFSVCITFQ
jgi:hypothetical protein